MASHGGDSRGQSPAPTEHVNSIPFLKRAGIQNASNLAVKTVRRLSPLKQDPEGECCMPCSSADINVEYDSLITKATRALSGDDSVSIRGSLFENDCDSGASVSEITMPQPKIVRRRLAKMPEPAPVIYDVGMLEVPYPLTWPLAPCSRLLAWFVWVADLLFMLNLIPGDNFRPFSSDPTVSF